LLDVKLTLLSGLKSFGRVKNGCDISTHIGALEYVQRLVEVLLGEDSRPSADGVGGERVITWHSRVVRQRMHKFSFHPLGMFDLKSILLTFGFDKPSSETNWLRDIDSLYLPGVSGVCAELGSLG
jgi:hypothetical protein